MRAGLQRIGRDLQRRRHIDAYVVAGMAFMFAVLSLVGDMVPGELRWAVLFAGVGLLVYRITVPDSTDGHLGRVLGDRTAFDRTPLAERLKTAREVWVYAPAAVNVLSPYHCDLLRRGMLARRDGVLRVVVLDPTAEAAVRLAVRQLDDALDYPIQRFRTCLETILDQLRIMTAWPIAGSVEHRLLDYNPGFSLVAIDPNTSHGTVIVEFHAFHNEATASRMHLELTRSVSDYWYSYWLDQFDRIWQSGRSAYEETTAGTESTEVAEVQ